MQDPRGEWSLLSGRTRKQSNWNSSLLSFVHVNQDVLYEILKETSLRRHKCTEKSLRVSGTRNPCFNARLACTCKLYMRLFSTSTDIPLLLQLSALNIGVDVDVYVLWGLKKLSRISSKVRKDIEMASGLEKILELLQAYTSNESIQIEGCGAICNVICEESSAIAFRRITKRCFNDYQADYLKNAAECRAF